MESLYVITRRDLAPGLQLAQSVHGFASFNDQHPEAIKAWKGNMRCLAAADAEELGNLATDLSRKGFKVAAFHEPDLGGALTAIAVEGSAQRLLSTLPCALRTLRAVA